jgi:urease accessory protein
VLGLMLAFAVRLAPPVCAAMLALFALFHGFAHGAELPVGASAAAYGGGFLLASLAVHLAGIAAGRSLQTLRAAVLRAAGVGVALSGAWMLAAA